MDPKDFEEEKALLKKLEARDIQAFKRFYKIYSDDLLIVAFSLLEDTALAIRTVDEFFERLWIEAKFELIDPPIHRFLYTELRKHCETGMN
jgi:hypothetical protein